MKKVKVTIEKHKTPKVTQAAPRQQEVRPWRRFFHRLKPSMWFILGIMLGLFFVISGFYIVFKHTYGNSVYPGVSIGTMSMSGKTEMQVREYFLEKSTHIPDSRVTFSTATMSATLSAQTLGMSYDATTLAHQAISVGRSGDPLSNISLILQAYTTGIRLTPIYTYKPNVIDASLSVMRTTLHTDPQNGLFTLTNNRVTAFQLSQNGQDIDLAAVKADISRMLPTLVSSKTPQTVSFTVPIIAVKPAVTSDSVSKMGIKELVASGSSLFLGSATERVYNINLAASRLNGVLIAPGDTFSFVKAVGDISADSGYKQAYVIENGHTVLGDGGGVCQVSTTMFRAALNAGLPIVERNPHAYRVHYYEEDQPVGIDAAVYSPTVDLKFRNDTPGYLLIQTVIDTNNLTLQFNLYGRKDNRIIKVDHPVILSTSPAPPPLNQDDPTLPNGVVKQTDFAADGANVYFTREVYKDGKQVIADKFTSNYRPWQAVFMHGTKT